jgi:uracil phosphoribosyltransferase
MDRQYRFLPRPAGGLAHDYGANVHILSEPYPMSLLARLGSPEVTQPLVGALVHKVYEWLLGQVVSRFFPVATASVPTRMGARHPEGVYEGELVDRTQRVVVIDVARAGIVPSLVFYDGLNHLLDPAQVRLDHVVASRTTDAGGRVVDVALGHTKIGGPVDGAIVLLPDPMAATGTSLAGVLDHYGKTVPGVPAAVIAVHLIVTPEYLRHMTERFPGLVIVSVRLDRGLSPKALLEARPGVHKAEECGLDDHQYIVPGAGGLGEVLNNSWI